jgi:hypothetical protein
MAKQKLNPGFSPSNTHSIVSNTIAFSNRSWKLDKKPANGLLHLLTGNRLLTFNRVGASPQDPVGLDRLPETSLQYTFGNPSYPRTRSTLHSRRSSAARCISRPGIRSHPDATPLANTAPPAAPRFPKELARRSCGCMGTFEAMIGKQRTGIICVALPSSG